MADITTFPGTPETKGDEVPSVVLCLRRVLARAEAGECVGVAMAWVSKDGEDYSTWAHVGDRTVGNALLVGLGAIQHEMHTQKLRDAYGKLGVN